MVGRMEVEARHPAAANRFGKQIESVTCSSKYTQQHEQECDGETRTSVSHRLIGSDAGGDRVDEGVRHR